MKKIVFYNVLIFVGILLFISSGFMFKEDDTIPLIFGTVELFLSLIFTVIGIKGNLKEIKE